MSINVLLIDDNPVEVHEESGIKSVWHHPQELFGGEPATIQQNFDLVLIDERLNAQPHETGTFRIQGHNLVSHIRDEYFRGKAVPILVYSSVFEKGPQFYFGRNLDGVLPKSIAESPEFIRRIVDGFRDVSRALKTSEGIVDAIKAAVKAEDLISLDDYIPVEQIRDGQSNRETEIEGESEDSVSIPLEMGKWILAHLLSKPGPLLDETAAAWYVGLAPSSFADCREQFLPAVYAGVFQDPDRPMWWRETLYDVYASKCYEHGLELTDPWRNSEQAFPGCDVSKCIVCEKPQPEALGTYPRENLLHPVHILCSEVSSSTDTPLGFETVRTCST